MSSTQDENLENASQSVEDPTGLGMITLKTLEQGNRSDSSPCTLYAVPSVEVDSEPPDPSEIQYLRLPTCGSRSRIDEKSEVGIR